MSKLKRNLKSLNRLTLICLWLASYSLLCHRHLACSRSYVYFGHFTCRVLVICADVPRDVTSTSAVPTFISLNPWNVCVQNNCKIPKEVWVLVRSCSEDENSNIIKINLVEFREVSHEDVALGLFWRCLPGRLLGGNVLHLYSDLDRETGYHQWGFL